ncbi:DUF3221 domain-containing protein [Bacillus cereus]|uniref:DUF3221 domain-containing protein n=1 Tax=Bacillus cereus TaxID=1396 RepID=UPI0014837613|nr:DUF3221 domain-containing protein [Bacillus cereus]
MKPFYRNFRSCTKETQIQSNSLKENGTLENPYLTGYIVAITSNSILVITASNKEEAYALKNNVYTLFLRNEIIVVKSKKNKRFCKGDKVAIYTKKVTFSIPPRTIKAKIEKVK